MRQAIIIIHGVGEQRPLETLKKFVNNVVGDGVCNKPDKMSSLFELRRLQLPKKRNQPLTDFYEYYWAHHMRDSQFRMVLSWFRHLLLRWPWKISRSIMPYYLLIWAILPAVVSSGIFVNWITSVAIAFFSALLFFDYHVLRISYGVIDDAARYLNPTPDNIEQRNKIRKEGIELLDSLHKSKKYSRIVIVGHSLG